MYIFWSRKYAKLVEVRLQITDVCLCWHCYWHHGELKCKKKHEEMTTVPTVAKQCHVCLRCSMWSKFETNAVVVAVAIVTAIENNKFNLLANHSCVFTWHSPKADNDRRQKWNYNWNIGAIISLYLCECVNEIVWPCIQLPICGPNGASALTGVLLCKKLWMLLRVCVSSYC